MYVPYTKLCFGVQIFYSTLTTLKHLTDFENTDKPAKYITLPVTMSEAPAALMMIQVNPGFFLSVSGF